MYNAGYTHVKSNWVTSWENSLPEIALALKDSGLDDDIDVAVEYRLKHSMERLDFLIYGVDESNNKNMVIVELKQWSQVQRVDSLNKVFTMVAKGVFEDHFHPSYQAYNYAGQLRSFNEYVQNEKVGIESCSYCHNMDSGFKGVMGDVSLFPFIPNSPVFLSGDGDKLKKFVKKYVSKKCHEILYEITNARTVPSDDFAKLIRDALSGNQMYTLDDRQSYALSAIVDTIKEAIFYDQKKTIIIKGGAGTGKSIVAINALGQLCSPKKKSQRITTFYVTVNSAPRKTMFNSLKYGKAFQIGYLRDLFKYPTAFVNRPKNEVPCIMVDEAHRLFKWKGGIGVRSGVNMLEEIINTARVSVFFIDDNQAVTTDDYATIDNIKVLAKQCRSQVVEGEQLELMSQYRVQGGYNYIQTIKYFLGLSDNKTIFAANNSYDFQVFDDPNDMFEAIKTKDVESQEEQAARECTIVPQPEKFNGRCRVVAGYTYEWASNRAIRDGVNDVIIPSKKFAKKWNLQFGTGVTAYSWVDDPLSINEIGCIHTCQGVDLNYCGVIIGKDIVYRDGKIQFDKTEHAKTDRSGIRTAEDELAERLIKNTYYVLLTRGVLGTYVYCEDQALNEYLKTLKQYD
ncbi:MAG: DUF2075 domain-containing protein [Erysipelotrichia bacterium]|nr:DUF2075 domain-containing protein [Erysipelotrichia bacterium]